MGNAYWTFSDGKTIRVTEGTRHICFGGSGGGGHQAVSEDMLISTSGGKISTKIEPELLSDKDCNFLLGALFGDMIARATSNVEPNGLRNVDGSRSNYAGSNRYVGHYRGTGAFHVYPSDDAQRIGAPLYIPKNLDGSLPTLLKKFKGQSAYNPSGSLTATSGNYEEPYNPGSISNRFLFGYNDGVTLLVAHVAGASGSRLDSSFQRGDNLIGGSNTMGSIQIGFVGGPGGAPDKGVRHTHLVTWYNGKLVSPQKVFCGGRKVL